MFTRYWLPAIALGLIVSAGSVEAKPVQHHSHQQPAGSNGASQPASNTNPSDFVAFKNDVQGIASALKTIATKSPPKDDSGQRSANAEEWAAIWALGVLIVAGLEMAITALGVFLVWRTLLHTREAVNEAKRAADAAENAVKETRTIGQAQVRGYFSINSASVQFLTDWVPGKAFPRIHISGKNNGQSPIQKFIWRPTLQFVSGHEFRERDMLGQWVGQPGVAISAGDPFTDSALILDMDIVDFAKTAISPNGDIVVRLRIEFFFFDVFNTGNTEVAFFAGVAGTFGSGAWKPMSLDPLPPISDWGKTENYHVQ